MLIHSENAPTEGCEKQLFFLFGAIIILVDIGKTRVGQKVHQVQGWIEILRRHVPKSKRPFGASRYDHIVLPNPTKTSFFV